MPVRFDDVLTAFEFVSGDGSGEAVSYRRTGRVYWRSAAAGVDVIEDDLPEGAEDDPNFIAIPRKQVLGLGKALALDFAREFLPKDYDAYRNFRALVTKRRVLEHWYDFESKATKRAVREWCELNEIEITN